VVFAAVVVRFVNFNLRLHKMIVDIIIYIRKIFYEFSSLIFI
jgi:hypothetical protein